MGNTNDSTAVVTVLLCTMKIVKFDIFITAVASCVSLALLTGCGGSTAETPDAMIGVWEDRPLYGMPGRQLATRLDLEAGGTGTITVQLLDAANPDLNQLGEPEMTGTVSWNVSDKILHISFSDWQNRIPNVTATGGADEILRRGDTYFVLRSSQSGAITVRYKNRMSGAVKTINASELKIANFFTLRGQQSYEISADGSIQMVGQPAVLSWTDPESGSIDYLVGQHIEFYRPGGFFVVSGGATIVRENDMAVNATATSTYVLFGDLSALLQDGSTTSTVERAIGGGLDFGQQ
jgi:hypothetical protein